MTNSKQLIGQIANDHLSIPTLEPRKSDSLDFHQVSVWAVETALNAAFEAGSQHAKSGIDIKQLLHARREVAIVWCIEDVKSVRPDLTDDQAWQVLERCDDQHDCEWGFTWSYIRDIAHIMFPEQPSTKE